MPGKLRFRKTVAATGSTSMITPGDLTLLGIMATPSAVDDFGYGLTHRYVGGQLRLYSTDKFDSLIEYLPIADASLASTPSAALQPTALHNFGDIYQTELVRLGDDGSGNAPPQVGAANVRPINGLYWDETDQRMYWLRSIFYQNITAEGSDTCLGYSTLNDTTHTGTGIGMWKLSPMSTFGNRWCFGMTPIPAAFASSYCSGRRLGVGFGGGLSIISAGPPSLGPCLYAINPPDRAVDPDHDYITTGITRLLAHPANVGRATRPSDILTCNNGFDAGSSNEWDWNAGFGGGTTGCWINGTNKQGFLSFASIDGGTLSSQIQANPAPTHTTFTVANAGDTHVNDVIAWPTNSTAGDPTYPYCVGTVSAVVTNAITVTNITDGHSNADTTGIPTVGGLARAGGFYMGGGQAATRWYTPLYIYDPVDLARVAQGTANAWSLTPTSAANFVLPGQTYPFPGTTQNSAPFNGRITALTFDATTKRLYLLAHYLPVNNGFARLIYIFNVNC